LGYFGSGESLPWPGQDWAIIGLVVGGLGYTPANQGDVESYVSSSGS